LRLVIGLFTALALVVGVLGVLTVGLAIDVLGLGESGAGLLSGALGIGGVLGGAVALGLSSRMRLGAGVRLGTLLLGLPIALAGLWPSAAAAVVLLALAGVGNVLFDVASYTLIQRVAADDVRARVFGVLESLAVGAVALGALAAIVLVELTGTRGALVVIGSVPPLLAVLAWRALDLLDEGHVTSPETEPDLAIA
jgi:MFS family permease